MQYKIVNNLKIINIIVISKIFRRKDINEIVKYAKSCNSNLYTKYPGATYSGLLLGTMRCLSCKFVFNYTLLKC